MTEACPNPIMQFALTHMEAVLILKTFKQMLHLISHNVTNGGKTISHLFTL